MGDINVYTGPMKCGKTQQILNEYKRQLIAGKRVKMFKPAIDTRAGKNVVASRNGIDIPATTISKLSDLEKYDVDVYCIDEFQFLKGNVNVIEQMATAGKKFFIAGLNLTAEKKPFGKMPQLLTIADNVQMQTAICDNCKNDNAVYTYFIGGKDSEIVIGDKQYKSLCRHCYDLLTKQDIANQKKYNKKSDVLTSLYF